MEILVRNNGLAPVEARQVRALLEAADNEFVPPLSSRTSSVQGAFDTGTSNRGIGEYFEQMMVQRFLLATTSPAGPIVGFMTYRDDHELPVEAARVARPTLYVTTLVVDTSARRHGIAHRFYQAIIDIAADEDRTVSTRTWSTNRSHLALCDQLGFRTVLTLPDHRGPGIDTVYLERDEDSQSSLGFVGSSGEVNWPPRCNSFEASFTSRP